VNLAHARETLPSSTSEGETAHGPQARKGMAIVLIARQTLTRHCLSRSFQNALPDLRLVAVAMSRVCSTRPDCLGAWI
jgi:hypothetical protein